MAFKYPWVLAFIIPLIICMRWLHRVDIYHAISFPKTHWMKPLTSKKVTQWLTLDRWLEWLILIILLITIAQPQWVKTQSYRVKKGIDIVALLDTSGSMNAEDFEPKNRLTVAKDTLIQFIKNRGNDRLGLIVFGSDALTKSPLTVDHRIITNLIDQIKVGDAGDGTAIGLAIATGINRLNQSTSASKVIILITDGVNNAGPIDPISAANLAQSTGIKIYTIGIGTQKGAPIPIYHPTYGKRYARHPNGQLVLTEFDDDTLKKIAAITKGQYFNATNTQELRAIYDTIDTLEKTAIKSKKIAEVYDLFSGLIGLLLVLLLVREGLSLTKLVGVRS